MSSHGGGGDRWLVSYADFITLLMVLFVVLYSMGQTDLQKYKELSEAFATAFGGGPTRVVDPSINNIGTQTDDMETAPIIVPGLPMVSSNQSNVANDINDMLVEANLSSDVSIQNNVEGLLISLSEKLIFVPNSADLLNPDAYDVLDKIIEMVKPLDNDIKVVGHTDNTPTIDSRYADNMQLSLGRAYTITNYFQQQGINPTRIIASGRGQYQPIFANDTDEHRSLNGRAEIIIIYTQDVDMINLDITNSLLGDTSVIP
ncbi:MAG: OmpA family protein [Anaerolineaceae bacterium]|nr:OmpA family protein [Anaerolineaceae bacterium]